MPVFIHLPHTKTQTHSHGFSPQVQVWDTAGQERFRKSMVEHYYRNVHAVVFVYDVTKMASFRNLQTWIEVGISLQRQQLSSVHVCEGSQSSTSS